MAKRYHQSVRDRLNEGEGMVKRAMDSAKKSRKGGDAYPIGNDYSKHANLPDQVMFKSAGSDYDGMRGREIGNELSNIREQLVGDDAKARSDFKLRKA